MANALTNDQTEKLEQLLYSMEGMFISIKNMAPNLENDVSVNGDMKEGVAWDEVIGAIGLRGQHVVDDALSVLSDAGMLKTQRNDPTEAGGAA